MKHVLATRPDDEVLVLDALTYAGNLENLDDVLATTHASPSGTAT